MRAKVVATALAAALGVFVVQPIIGSAATVPAVHAVTVPSVTTPVATTPAVTTPTVSVPSVTTPAVTVPSVTTPVATTPSVTVPPVTTPTVTAPTGQAPSSTTTSPSVGSTVQKISSAAGGAASTPTGAPAGLARGVGSAGGRRATRPQRQRTKHLGAARASAENRRVRSLVTRLRGCLATLDPRSLRLLSLRAGLDGSPRSATAVARILHVSLTREQLLEQLSLVELQSQAGAVCAGPTAGETVGATEPSVILSSTAPGLSSSSSASPAASRSAGRAGSTARSAHRRGPRPVVVISPAAATGKEQRAGAGTPGFPGAAVLTFVVLAAGLSLLALPGVRRRVLHMPGTRASTGSAAAGPARAVTGAPATTATAAAAEGVRRRPLRTTGDTPATPAGDAPAYSQARVEPHAPQPRAQPQPDVPRHPRWAREHATQAALVATVIAGGVARLVTRGRRRR